MKKVLLAIGIVVVLAGVGIGSWVAFAGDGGEETVRGTCGSGSYELTVEDEDNQLEVTFELQSTRPGETWDVVVEQDGTPLFEGQRETDEDAELDVDVPAEESGGDEFTVTATPAGAADGDACTATITR